MSSLKLLLIFGGKSAEHEVSFRSARSVYNALDKSRYSITLCGIDKKGVWRLSDEGKFTSASIADGRAFVAEEGPVVSLVPGETATLVNLSNGKEVVRPDVVFPVLHGPLGEDGTVQGLLELCGAAYVGCGVLSSAICMDKEAAKRLLQAAGVPVAPWICLLKPEVRAEEVKRTLGFPCFVKPACLGSSVGVSKATDEKTLLAAVKHAFTFDTKVLIEKAIAGAEIECSVLGYKEARASVTGAIVPAEKHGFYSYEAKYLDDDGALLKIPSGIPASVEKEVRGLAVRAYQALCCDGMARVDFFVNVKPDGSAEIIINELNTIPGFTSISMYPKLWEAAGLQYSKLLDDLISLGIERQKEKASLNTSAFKA